MAETITNTSPDVKAKSQCATQNASTGVVSIKDGLVPITYAGVCAMTLALPTAGVDDGKELTFVDVGGHTHTITTPTNGINGADHVATFGGTAYTVVTFRAYNGGWVVAYSVTGITFS